MTPVGPRLAYTVGYLIVPVTIAVIVWYALLSSPSLPQVCHRDYTQGGIPVCRPQCPMGRYSLQFMTECKPWLTCREILSDDFKIVKPLGAGAVKVVYLAEWQGLTVVYNTLAQPAYREDFQHGLRSLANLQPSDYVTQFLGYCKDTFVTEYHPLGSADKVNDLLRSELFWSHNTLHTRLGLCISYAQVINYLHTHPRGKHVMCDSNDLNKALGQFLLTSDLRLKVNDVDALPIIRDGGTNTVKCGHRQLMGDFVAPEQLWPYTDQPFSDKLMPGYNEKTDVWKVPNICDNFLGQVTGSDTVRFHLFDIHKQCKSLAPEDRPAARQVLSVYIKVQQQLGIS